MSLFRRKIATTFSMVLHPPSLKDERLKELTFTALTTRFGKLLSVTIGAVTTVKCIIIGSWYTER
jgi:hypothetical protein